VSSGGRRKVFRLSRRGNGRLNHAIHIAASGGSVVVVANDATPRLTRCPRGLYARWRVDATPTTSRRCVSARAWSL
jgi:hypothetical protein